MIKDIVNYLRKTRRGAMFVLDGLSGVGKNTIIEKLLKKDKSLRYSISVTTRSPRPGEKDGVNYHFVSDVEYDKLLSEDAFYEHVESDYGGKYGTLRSEVDSFLTVGQDVLFDLDFPGMVQLKGKAPNDVVTIGVLPPSIKTLVDRLNTRGEKQEVIDKRLKTFRTRLSYIRGYDYIVINDDLDETVGKVQRIISGERMKRVRQIGMPEFINQLFDEIKEIEGKGKK